MVEAAIPVDLVIVAVVSEYLFKIRVQGTVAFQF
jgi:hypothetical protein